jgi:hypothetical protein
VWCYPVENGNTGRLCYSCVDINVPCIEAAIRGTFKQADLMKHVNDKVYSHLSGKKPWGGEGSVRSGAPRPSTSSTSGSTKHSQPDPSAKKGRVATPAADVTSGDGGGDVDEASDSLLSFDRLSDGTVVNVGVLSRAFGGQVAVAERLFRPELPKAGCAPVCDSDVVRQQSTSLNNPRPLHCPYFHVHAVREVLERILVIN